MIFKKQFSFLKKWICKKEKGFTEILSIFQVIIPCLFIEVAVILISTFVRFPHDSYGVWIGQPNNARAMYILIPNIFLVIFAYCTIHFICVRVGYIPKTLFVKLHSFLNRIKNRKNTEETLGLEQDDQFKGKKRRIYMWDGVWILISAIGFFLTI